jgi:hypothetical protein
VRKGEQKKTYTTLAGKPFGILLFRDRGGEHKWKNNHKTNTEKQVVRTGSG